VPAIRRAARGESFFAAEVAGEVVGELAAHLERAESAREQDQALQARIRDVIDARRLYPLFQPIVDLGTEEAIGVEALVRFDAAPEQGPEAWFADAEAAGLRLELELAAAEAAAAAFSAHQCPGFLAVNASPDALPGLVPLAAELRDRLVVEVTEHAAVDDYETIGTSLAALRESGARLAVDDAGAGYASLRHVLELGPEIVKLDLTLTRDIDRDSRRRAVARGLAAAADELGSTIVAEGVETAAELETLVGLGVRFGQGYLLGRPAPLAT
jgi:EAL domain-containing protein (putative c-di-GMP-specific phosphodiesterase class I)